VARTVTGTQPDGAGPAVPSQGLRARRRGAPSGDADQDCGMEGKA